MQWYQQYGQTLEDANGNEYTSGLAYMDFLYDGLFVEHRVLTSEVGRLDLIAWKYKEIADPTMWRTIAWVNGIIDPLKDVYAGRTLLIPVQGINQLTDFEPSTYAGDQ